LLDTLCHVPAFQKDGLPPAAQIHRLSNTVSTVVVLPFDISLVVDVFGRKKEQPAKHQHSHRGSAAVLTSCLAKTNCKKIKEESEIRGNLRPKYDCRKRDKCFQLIVVNRR
jgi:hypothetical protein